MKRIFMILILASIMTGSYSSNLPIPPPPENLMATIYGTTQINLSFTPNSFGNNIILVWNNIGTFAIPSGTPPSPGDPFAGGTLLYNGTTSPVQHTGLTPSTHYYYRAWSVDSSNQYSEPVSADTSTPCPAIITFPFEEHFSDVTQFCWESFSGNPSHQWHYEQQWNAIGGDHTNPGTGYFAMVDPGGDNISIPVQLTSPPLDISGLNNPCLNFYYYYSRNLSYPDDISLNIFANGVWHNTIWSVPNTWMNDWGLCHIPLDSFKVYHDVMVQFSYNNGMNLIGFDDVSVYDQPLCPGPPAQPAGLTLIPGSSSINGSFDPAVSGPTNYLVIVGQNPALTFSPADFTAYQVGQDLGNNEVVVDNDHNNSFNANILNPGTHYYFFIFAFNQGDCIGPRYNALSPLTGDAWTAIADPAYLTAVPADLPQGYSGIDVSFFPGNGYDVLIVWNNTGTFTTPSGAPPDPGMAFAGGMVLYKGQNSPVHHTGLMTGTGYYYRAFSFTNGNQFSSGMTTNTWTPDGRACCPDPWNGQTDIGTTAITFNWNTNGYTSGYQLNLGTFPGGSDLIYRISCSGNSYTLPGNLDPGTHYYWKVYTEMPGGKEFEGDVWNFTTSTLTTTVYPFNDIFSTGYVTRNGEKFDDTIETYECPNMKLGFIKFDFTELDPLANITGATFCSYPFSSPPNAYNVNLVKPLNADPVITPGNELFNKCFEGVSFLEESDYSPYPDLKCYSGFSQSGLDFLNTRKFTGWAGFSIDRLEHTSEIDYYGYTDPREPYLTLNYGISSVPIFHCDPNGYDFGEYSMNNFSSDLYTRIFTVSNSGSGTLIITGCSIDGADAATFILSDLNSCPVNLLPGQKLQFNILFNPLTTGSKNALVHLTSEGLNIYELSLSGHAYVNPPRNLHAVKGSHYDIDLDWSPPVPEGELRYDKGFSGSGLSGNDTNSMVCTRFKAPRAGNITGMAVSCFGGTSWKCFMLCNDDGTGRPDLNAPLVRIMDIPICAEVPYLAYVPLPVPQPVESGLVFYIVAQWPQNGNPSITFSEGEGQIHSLGSQDHGETWNTAYDYSLGLRAYMETSSHLLSYTLHKGFSSGNYSTDYTTNSLTYNDTNTLPGVKYYYSVDAVYGSAASGNSNEASVTVRQIPLAPTLPHPKNNGINISPDDSLCWMNNGNVQLIDLYLSSDSILVMTKNPSARIWTDHPVTGHCNPPSGFSPGKNFWKVVCKDNETPLNVAEGPVWNFSVQVTTLPVAITLDATQTGCSATRLNGTINANGAMITASFDWGLTDSYGNTQIATPGQVSGNTLTAVEADLSSLLPGTLYHYRVVASATSGSAYGTDLTFTTSPLPAEPGSISGPLSLCQGTTNVRYSVDSVQNALSYTWTIPPGASISNGTGTRFIRVDFGSNASSGNVTVAGQNNCGDGIVSTLAVAVNTPPGKIGNISGPAEVCCEETRVIYSVEPFAGATLYSWTFPAGMTIISVTNTNTVAVNVNAKIFTGNITVVAMNDCGTSFNIANLAVHSVKLPNKTTNIHGEINVCQGSTQIYSVNPVNYASGYVWTIPPGVTILSGNNTSKITVYFTFNSVTGNFSVYAWNACGNGPVSNPLNVMVTPQPVPPVITYNAALNRLTSNITNGNQWYLNGNSINGATKQTYTPKRSGDYYDIITIPPCSSPPSNTIHVPLAKEDSVAGLTVTDQDGFELNVFPNPNEGTFRCQINCPDDEMFTIELKNYLGISIFNEKNIRVNSDKEEEINLTMLPDGIYMLFVYNDRVVMTKKVIISK